MKSVNHILVVFDDSKAARRALRQAAAIADEHRARISVATLIDYDPPTIGCCLRSAYWNGVLDEVALAELDAARRTLGDRDPAPKFEIVPGSGAEAVQRLASRLRCDLVLVPVRGWFAARAVRRIRQRVPAGVLGVRAA